MHLTRSLERARTVQPVAQVRRLPVVGSGLRAAQRPRDVAVGASPRNEMCAIRHEAAQRRRAPGLRHRCAVLKAFGAFCSVGSRPRLRPSTAPRSVMGLCPQDRSSGLNPEEPTSVNQKTRQGSLRLWTSDVLLAKSENGPAYAWGAGRARTWKNRIRLAKTAGRDGKPRPGDRPATRKMRILLTKNRRRGEPTTRRAGPMWKNDELLTQNGPRVLPEPFGAFGTQSSAHRGRFLTFPMSPRTLRG